MSKVVDKIVKASKLVPIKVTTYNYISFMCEGIACQDCPVIQECDLLHDGKGTNKKAYEYLITTYPELLL